jgi:hypothetical protein
MACIHDGKHCVEVENVPKQEWKNMCSCVPLMGVRTTVKNTSFKKYIMVERPDLGPVISFVTSYPKT